MLPTHVPPTIVDCFLKINQMLSLHGQPVSLFNPHLPRHNFLVWHPFFVLLLQPKNFLITPLCMAPLSRASPTHSQNFWPLLFVWHYFPVLLPQNSLFFLFHSSLCATTFLCFSCTWPKIFNCCSLCGTTFLCFSCKTAFFLYILLVFVQCHFHLFLSQTV